MAEIRPFQGIRYNQQVIQDLSSVICPPYDIISPQQQDALYKLSPYNFVRIEYNRELPQDTSQDNRYTRASINLAQWLKEGVLQADGSRQFTSTNTTLIVWGSSARGRISSPASDWKNGTTKVIRPHENIIPRAKSDRLSMLYACQANTSPVLAMY